MFKLPIATAEIEANTLLDTGWTLTTLRTNANWWFFYGVCKGL